MELKLGSLSETMRTLQSSSWETTCWGEWATSSSRETHIISLEITIARKRTSMWSIMWIKHFSRKFWKIIRWRPFSKTMRGSDQESSTDLSILTIWSSCWLSPSKILARGRFWISTSFPYLSTMIDFSTWSIWPMRWSVESSKTRALRACSKESTQWERA